MLTRLTQPGTPHSHTVQEHGAPSLPPARRAEPLPHHASPGLMPNPCAECSARLAAAHWHCRTCVWRKK